MNDVKPPLISALENFDYEAAEMLIKGGADVNVVWEGKTPLSVAVDENLLGLRAPPEFTEHLPSNVYEDRKAIIALLLKKGAATE